MLQSSLEALPLVLVLVRVVLASLLRSTTCSPAWTFTVLSVSVLATSNWSAVTRGLSWRYGTTPSNIVVMASSSCIIADTVHVV